MCKNGWPNEHNQRTDNTKNKSGWFIGLIYWIFYRHFLDIEGHKKSLEIAFLGDLDEQKLQIFPAVPATLAP